MPRIGTNPNISSDQLEGKFIPQVDDAKPEGEGGYIDLIGDGQHKLYLNPAQLETYNWQSRITYFVGGRGLGKTSLLAVWEGKCFLGLPRQMGGFLGASAKQLFTRTMPNVLKVLNMLGFQEGQFFFRGQAPAKLRWPMPLAKPRVWENVIHFATGYCEIMLSMAVRGSGNGLNLACLKGDETKYLPWDRVKEEIMPTVRGDVMPPAASKTQKRMWGYGTNGAMNPFWLSQLWVSDRGLTSRECLWEKDRQFETTDVNGEITQMLAELKYLEHTNPRLAAELAQNEMFLKKLHLLRRDSMAFWNWSTLENIKLLGESFVAQLKRTLPPLMFNLQILGYDSMGVKDGWYNFDETIHTYTAPEIADEVNDRYTVQKKGRALDVQKWPTDYETETLDWAALEADGLTCALDSDLDYDSPLFFAVDCNANLNCLVCGQERIYNGKPSFFTMKTFYTMNEVKLIGLIRNHFYPYYRPFFRHGGSVIFCHTPSIHQGGNVAYAVEGADDFRFDRVIIRELKALGVKVEVFEFASVGHAQKHEIINSMLSGFETPALYVNREKGRNDYLIVAIQQAEVKPGTFFKDKSREKYKSEDGVAGDVRTRTDVTDAWDDLILGVKFFGRGGNRKVGSGLRGRFKNLSVMR